MSHYARLTSPCSGIAAVLWLRGSRSPMVHACRDSRLSVLPSTLLLDLYPIAVLVLYGLGQCSSRAHENPATLLYWPMRKTQGGLCQDH